MRTQTPPRAVAGYVNANGAIIQGSGFTITHTTTGVYTINITIPGFKLQGATVSCGAAWAFVTTGSFTGSSFQILIANTAASTLIDQAFSFTAVGA